MFTLPVTTSGNCRTAVVPTCDVGLDTSQSAPTPALTLFPVRSRDTVDYSVDFGPWLASNGGALLSGATWSIAAASPKIPVIIGQGFNPTGMTSVVLAPAAGALAGDAYWLDIIATIALIPASATNPIVMPPRTLERRVNFVVVSG